MNTRDWTKEEAEVISMEEYLAKRKKIREDERKHKKKGSDDREESLMPFEFYMVSSLASILSSPAFTTTSFLSDLTLDVMDPAPMWDL